MLTLCCVLTLLIHQQEGPPTSGSSGSTGIARETTKPWREFLLSASLGASGHTLAA